jgi:hypothetical protein
LLIHVNTKLKAGINWALRSPRLFHIVNRGMRSQREGFWPRKGGLSHRRPSRGSGLLEVEADLRRVIARGVTSRVPLNVERKLYRAYWLAKLMTVVVADRDIKQVSRSNARWVLVVLLGSRRRHLDRMGAELGCRARIGNRLRGGRADATAEQSGLELLVRRQRNASVPGSLGRQALRIDERSAACAGKGLRAGVIALCLSRSKQPRNLTWRDFFRAITPAVRRLHGLLRDKEPDRQKSR